MRLSLWLAMLTAGLLIAAVPYKATAAPATTSARGVNTAVASHSIEKAYYYRGRYYPYHYRGGYYSYRYRGQYFRHRYYRHGRWHYY